MHHLTVLLNNPLCLIGSGSGSGERLIAATIYPGFMSAISRPPELTAEPIRRSAPTSIAVRRCIRG
jgi:hypothetical protein